MEKKQVRIEKVPVYRYSIYGETEFPLVEDLFESFKVLINLCDEETFYLFAKEFLVFQITMGEMILKHKKSP